MRLMRQHGLADAGCPLVEQARPDAGHVEGARARARPQVAGEAAAVGGAVADLEDDAAAAHQRDAADRWPGDAILVQVGHGQAGLVDSHDLGAATEQGDDAGQDHAGQYEAQCRRQPQVERAGARGGKCVAFVRLCNAARRIVDR